MKNNIYGTVGANLNKFVEILTKHCDMYNFKPLEQSVKEKWIKCFKYANFKDIQFAFAEFESQNVKKAARPIDIQRLIEKHRRKLAQNSMHVINDPLQNWDSFKHYVVKEYGESYAYTLQLVENLREKNNAKMPANEYWLQVLKDMDSIFCQ